MFNHSSHCCEEIDSKPARNSSGGAVAPSYCARTVIEKNDDRPSANVAPSEIDRLGFIETDNLE